MQYLRFREIVFVLKRAMQSLCSDITIEEEEHRLIRPGKTWPNVRGEEERWVS